MSYPAQVEGLVNIYEDSIWPPTSTNQHEIVDFQKYTPIQCMWEDCYLSWVVKYLLKIYMWRHITRCCPSFLSLLRCVGSLLINFVKERNFQELLFQISTIPHYLIFARTGSLHWFVMSSHLSGWVSFNCPASICPVGCGAVEYTDCTSAEG